MLSVRSPPSLPLAIRTHHSRLVLLSTGQRRTFKTRSVGPRQNTTTPRRPDSVHLGVHVPAVRITGPAISLLNSRRPTSTAMMGRGDSSSPKRSGPSCPKTSGSTTSFSMPGSGTLSSTVKTLVDGCDTFSSVRPAPRGTPSAKENQQEADHRHNSEGGPRDLNRRAHRVAEPLSFTAARGGHERGNEEGHNV